MKRVYLDHNATSPLKPEVAAAMLEVLQHPCNASSVHAEGRAARQSLERARAQVAALAGARPRNVYFTSGATEANNWVLRGATGRPTLVAATEHPSVLHASAGPRIPVQCSGLLDLDALDSMLAEAEQPMLVSVMLVNNETGVIQPTRAIADIAHRHGALMHGDAVQAAGRIVIDMAELGLDYLTLSSHKLGGPQGIGALVTGASIDPQPWTLGGTQESRRRAGTENVAGAVGFGVAAELAQHAVAGQMRLANLRDAMERQLTAAVPELIVTGRDAPRSGNTSMVALPGLLAETQLMAMDIEGIAVSSGAACSSGKVEPSHVLTAMGYDALTGKSAIRVSMGWTTTDDDVDQFIASWQKLASQHARRRATAMAEP